MRRLLVLIIILASFLAACEPRRVVSPEAAPSPLASKLHEDVVAASNYEAAQVHVAVLPNQVVVTISDSNLLAASHAERDADAARIAFTLEKRIEADAALAPVHAIHVDYVSKDGAGAAAVKDSVDYRRNAAGRFTKDIT